MLQLRKKDLREMNVLKFGYCDIYYICQALDQVGYTCWIYWRNEDIYKIPNSSYFISTWYRPTWERPLNEKKRNNLELTLKKNKAKRLKVERETRRKRIQKKIEKLLNEHIEILYNRKKYNEILR